MFEPGRWLTAFERGTMGGADMKVATKQFADLPKVHVADKWYVLRYTQKAPLRVVSQQLDCLEKPPKETPPVAVDRMTSQAAAIRTTRKQLMGARLIKGNSRQGLLGLDGVGAVLVMNHRIGIIEMRETPTFHCLEQRRGTDTGFMDDALAVFDRKPRR